MTRRSGSSTASRSRLATLREAIGVIRPLANGEQADYKGSELRFPWGERLPAADLGRRLRAEGTGPGGRGRRRLHLAAGRPGHHRLVDRRRARRRGGGRPRPGLGHHLRRRARLRHRRQRRGPGSTAAISAAGSAGWSATTSPTSSARYGADGAAVPTALSDYIAGRQGYDYNAHGRAGNTHADFVPDEVIDRFCLIGPPDAQVERLRRAPGARRLPVRASTCSTTPRTRRWRRTARRSCPRSTPAGPPRQPRELAATGTRPRV